MTTPAALNDINLVQIPIEDEMKRSYLDYAMSVIVSRAIPDVRDGLKPVHRRILFAMYEAGYHAGRQHRKSARVVGDVIGKYHPHGDSAVYDSLVRMAQPFSLRSPLVDGQGNFGSIDGDAPAAMRYTESRLTRISHTLLEDIDKDTVEFTPNYDGSEQEPVVLPSMFPNLLVNGSGGIAVGMATNIPPHNLGEVISACCAYIDNNEIEPLELMSIVKGPDFPTSGVILGLSGIRSAYLTGRGSIIMRGRTHVEEVGNRSSIIITEIPYMVNKAKLVEKVADLVREKKIEGISDLRDESNKDGIRVCIELKKDIAHEVILNQLYSYTQLQTSFGVIMLALDNGLPKVMNLKQVIAAFVSFRESVITRRTIYLLNKARDKAHVLLGLRVAVNHIDEIIALIKAASDPSAAKEGLMSKSWQVESFAAVIKLVEEDTSEIDEKNFKFTETQAKAILEMRLARLTSMEKDKIDNDLTGLSSEIAEFLDIITNRDKMLGILKDELLKIKADFGEERKTIVEEGEFDTDIEDLIPREDMVVTVTHGGYIKRVPLASYKSQHRGGKGRSGVSMRDDDITTQIFVGSTHTPMMFFSNLGQVYSLKLYKLPLGGPQSKGRPMVNILPLKIGENITNIMPLPEDVNDWENLNIMFSTSNGNIRRNDLSDFKRIQSNGKIAIRLDEDDSLVDVRICKEDDHILLASQLGKALRFPVSELRVFRSRKSDGVRGMRLIDSDKVISMTILKGSTATIKERESFSSISIEQRLSLAQDEHFDATTIETDLSKERLLAMASMEEFILTISENGFGKRSSAYEYRVAHRGGIGITNMNLSTKTGQVVASMPARATDELMLITDSGKLIRCKLASVRVTSRSTSGVILFKLESGEKVVSASLIADNGDSEEEAEVIDKDE